MSWQATSEKSENAFVAAATNGIRASGTVDVETWRNLFSGVLLPGNDLNVGGLVTSNEFGD